jgi:phospholipid/cholesterol/gamma-HCH transport system permease protein
MEESFGQQEPIETILHSRNCLQPLSNSENVRPRLSFAAKESGVLVVKIAGDWLRRSGPPDVSAVEQELSKNPMKALEFDATDLGKWDSALLVRVLALYDVCQKTKVEFRFATLPGGLAKLIELSQAVPEKKDAARHDEPTTFLQRIGESGLGAWMEGRAMLGFLGESAVAAVKMVRGRAQFRWSDTLLVMQECGPEALGIVALINFLIGLILAFVGATELARFGASIYTADLVAVATVREMACIMTGIILCGRTGAAFAAQLGTMKVNQEIEAFQTFGISPSEFLVLPRMLALILMMPLLCIFADLIAIAGGFMVCTMMLDVAPRVYVYRTIASIQLSGLLLGIFKGGFFGVLVALTGCLRGMQCGTNAAAVGQATTSAVVTGITWIIASDGIFALICNALHI